MGILSQEQLALLTDYDPGSAYCLAYHTAFANIRFEWDSERFPQYSILLATPSAYAGYAAAVANIAIAAAQSGTPTILVDADLRSPALQQRFALGDQPGLHELLSLRSLTPQSIAPFLHQLFVPNLYLLCGGKTLARPQESSIQLAACLRDILSSLRDFLAEAEQRPALIIFNSAPVLTGMDASQIGSLVERTFLAVASGHTTRTQARRAQEQLQRAHAHLAGILMLDV